METPAEILAKKMIYRGKRLRPRNIFDIAAAVTVLDQEQIDAGLSSFPQACKDALAGANRMRPDLARTVMGRCLAKEGFEDLHAPATPIPRGVLTEAGRVT